MPKIEARPSLTKRMNECDVYSSTNRNYRLILKVSLEQIPSFGDHFGQTMDRYYTLLSSDKPNTVSMSKCPEASSFPKSTLYCTINLMPKSRGGVIMNFGPTFNPSSNEKASNYFLPNRSVSDG